MTVKSQKKGARRELAKVAICSLKLKSKNAEYCNVHTINIGIILKTLSFAFISLLFI